MSYLNNSTMMDVDFLPEHLIVIGGSYVGLEFAQMYRRFGSEVTIVEMGPRLIQREDEDVSEAVRAILEAEGITMRLSAECIALEKRGDKVAVNVDCSSGDKTVIGSHALLAVGRVPNTADLGLENAGVALDQRGYFRWMINSAPMCLASTPWAIAMGAEPSLTLHITITRLSPPIFWMVTSVVSATASRPTPCTLIRRWAGPE